MNNTQLLNVLKDSFAAYLSIGTSRSNSKLKSLHGKIAADLASYLGTGFHVMSQGYKDDKEGCIDGRYYSKNVDITISHREKIVAGYAVKFVMRNYSQNSNNYFENMLGETANIRSNSIPYFQIFIIFDKLPYYKKGGTLHKYDNVTVHNLEKYVCLSNDSPESFFHTPDKTLIVLLNLKEKSENYLFKDEDEYNKYYLSVINDPDLITYKQIGDVFGETVILNNYEDFKFRTRSIIMGKLKNPGTLL